MIYVINLKYYELIQFKRNTCVLNSKIINIDKIIWIDYKIQRLPFP